MEESLITRGLDNYRRRVYTLAAGVVLTGSIGNSLLRAGLRSGEALVTLSPGAYLKEFANVLVIAGVLILMLGFILQLSLLSWADLTYALPVTSSSYVMTTAIGALALNESVSVTHWAGVLLIIAGVVLVGRTRPLTSGTPFQ